MKYYELDFVEMDGNEVTRDFRHFTDENEAKQMFNDLKTNPEIVKVTRNELFKGDGENYLGGSEERERFVNSEPEMHRMFLNSRLGDKRFIAEPVTDYFGRRNRARKRFLQFEPVSENKLGKLLGARNYKYVGDPMNGKAIVPGPMDANEKNQLIRKARNMGLVAKPNMGGGVTIFVKATSMEEADLTKGETQKLKKMSKSLKKSSKGHAGQAKYIDKLVKERKDAFSGYFSKTNLGRMIMDAEEILKSGMQNGELLDNETEMLVRQELKKLKQLYVDNHGYTGIMATADPDLKKTYREGMNLESIYEDLKEDEGKTISLYPFYNERLAQKLFAMGIKDGYAWDDFLGKKLGGFWNGDPEGDGTMMYNIKEPLYSELRSRIKTLLKQIMADTLEENMFRVNHRLSYIKKDGEEKSIDFISGLNAEDEVYELMNDDDFVSAKIEYMVDGEVKSVERY